MIKNLHRFIFIALAIFILQACGSASLGVVPMYNIKTVNVIDHRSVADKRTLRDNVLSAIIFFGDDQLEPNLKNYFIAKLAAKKPGSILKLDIAISQYRVADYFPKRMSAGVKEWVFMPNTDTKIVAQNDLPTNTDMVICYFDGVVNGKKIIAKGVYPYTMNAGSMMVRSDPNFVNAVNRSIDNVVDSIYTQLNQEK